MELFNQRIFIMFKPESIKTRLCLNIANDIENKLYDSIGNIDIQLRVIDTDIIQKHYREHMNKEFFDLMCSYYHNRQVGIASVKCLIPRNIVIEHLRQFVGATDPAIAEKGTIRNKYGYREFGQIRNMIHVSDSPSSADRELKIWFDQDPIKSPWDGIDSAIINDDREPVVNI